MSIGGGVGLLVLLVIAAAFAEGAWVRIASAIYVVLVVILAIVDTILNGIHPGRLILLTFLVVFALYVFDVKRANPEP